ncbi:sodium ABC transporter permease, partial [Burkholderia multivorans]
LVWASTLTSDRARSIVLTIIGILTVGGAMAPVIVGTSGTVGRVLSWTPFTSPLGIAGRFFSAQPEWWEGLVAATIAAVLALILHAVAGGAYVRSVLSGGGRGGKTVKMSKRAKKVAAASDSEEDADAKASTASAKGAAKTATATKDADADADSDDADADEVVTVSETEEVTTTKTAGATKAADTTASAKGTRTTKATDDAMGSGKDSDTK